MTKEEEYIQMLKNLGVLFQELSDAVEYVIANIEEMRKKAPTLKKERVECYLKVAQSYSRRYKCRGISPGWSLERDMDYTLQNMLSFFREFDEAYLPYGENHEKWNPRIEQIYGQIEKQEYEIRRLLETLK
ncbi:MAG: hypothetical protein H6544_06080 [Prevotellaceae bacterium]|nr:hypothetical protein [Prevotellaceae bacterium]